MFPVSVQGRATGQLPSAAAGSVPAPTPEPASGVLLTTGVVLALVLHRFHGRGHRRQGES
jgi:hypothetical protein